MSASKLTAFVAGLLFAVGLGISGMTQPAKVIGFLDIFGSWDPSLVFVMGGALVVYFLTFRFVRGEKPVLAERFWLPTATHIDGRLVGGAALFGIGWGLAGYCPGPAITSLGAASMPAVLFVVAMAAGMLAYRLTLARRR